jgi:hypothetical protein
MYDPLSGDPQWIEVHNRAENSYRLKDFTISDSDSQKTYTLPEFVLEPDGYCVITASTSDFPYPGLECLLQPENGFPYLNKSEDIVYLEDETGFILESIHYFASMGGASGVSLERISPDVSGAERVNWGGSVDPDGATPGKKNSLWTGTPSRGGSLNSSPNPFFPNGDGDRDFTIISYSLPYSLSKLKLTVLDVTGRELISLADGIWAASKGNLIWDGRDASGSLVPSGIYVLYLEAVDTVSPGIFVEKRTIVLGRR